jgi:alginate O-acetyltransferase complex protein AlgI
VLFNSFPFLFGFLPISLALYVAATLLSPRWRLHALLALSFAFYAYWDWRFAPLLAASIFINWLTATIFLRTKFRVLLTITIWANLALLGVFKYLNFFVGLITTAEAAKLSIALPLGISFFTFHHIMYLTDVRRGQAPRFGLIQYGLYIAFFPQVLSGPLVRWREIMHQFLREPYTDPESSRRFARGIVLIILGLCEKTLLGDNLADIATPIFTASQLSVVSFSDAWLAALAFTFQIFFDFSGYTDMALGIACLFDIELPQNFNSPYRSTSLQDFWRRWHMTLSRFLRDYLYIPLGGSRHGLPRQVWALFATMALGGLWHGAGLTFVAWGVMHGVGLGAGVLWRRAGMTMSRLLGWPLTFFYVMFCWILFRAPSFESAGRMFRSLLYPSALGRSWSHASALLIVIADLQQSYCPKLGS